MKHRKLLSKKKQSKLATIEKRFSSNSEKVVELMNKNIDLIYERKILTADKIYDDVINVGTKKNPEYKNVKKIGWMEGFEDEDTKEVVWVDRSEIIEVEGKKTDGWRPIEYYTLSDIE